MQTKECYREYIKSQIAKPRIWHTFARDCEDSYDRNRNSKNLYNLKSNPRFSNFSHSITYPRDKLIERKIFHIIKSYTKLSYFKCNNGNQLRFVRTNSNLLYILIYCAMPSEVWLYNLINLLRKNKKYYVLVPKIMKNDFKAVKFCLPLVNGCFAIKEPNNKPIERNDMIDIAIVPVLGVDRNLKRIGFGMGMYDRFYSRLRIRPYTIFVSRRRFISNATLCHDYDIYADMYLSGK